MLNVQTDAISVVTHFFFIPFFCFCSLCLEFKKLFFLSSFCSLLVSFLLDIVFFSIMLSFHFSFPITLFCLFPLFSLCSFLCFILILFVLFLLFCFLSVLYYIASLAILFLFPFILSIVLFSVSFPFSSLSLC